MVWWLATKPTREVASTIISNTPAAHVINSDIGQEVINHTPVGAAVNSGALQTAHGFTPAGFLTQNDRLKELWNNYTPFGAAFNAIKDEADKAKESGSTSSEASETLAKIHREQWQDWKDRFQPRLEALAGYATSGSLTEADIGRADQSVQSSFMRARASELHRQQGLGLNVDPRQQKSSQRAMDLAEQSSRASARNQARIAGQDRDMQILSGGGSIGLEGLDRLRGSA